MSVEYDIRADIADIARNRLYLSIKGKGLPNKPPKHLNRFFGSPA